MLLNSVACLDRHYSYVACTLQQHDNTGHTHFILYDFVYRSMEGTTEKTGGMSFEVILKPASSDAAPPHVPGSPTKDRPLSQGDIEKKLKEAEERRHVIYCFYGTENR